METKVRSLPSLNRETDTLLKKNVRKVGKLVLSRTSCLHFGTVTYRQPDKIAG
jgi:hypothetical protein